MCRVEYIDLSIPTDFMQQTEMDCLSRDGCDRNNLSNRQFQVLSYVPTYAILVDAQPVQSEHTHDTHPRTQKKQADAHTSLGFSGAPRETRHEPSSQCGETTSQPRQYSHDRLRTSCYNMFDAFGRKFLRFLAKEAFLGAQDRGNRATNQRPRVTAILPRQAGRQA